MTIIIKVAQSILLMTTEMLITILLKKRIKAKVKVTMVTVMAARKHSQKISVKRVKQKIRYINLATVL